MSQRSGMSFGVLRVSGRQSVFDLTTSRIEGQRVEISGLGFRYTETTSALSASVLGR